MSIFNRKWSRATIQCQVCHPDTSVQNRKVPDPQGCKCKSSGCNFVIGDSGLNPSTELKRYIYVLFYSLGKASLRVLAQLFDLSAASTYQSVVAAGIEEIDHGCLWAQKTKRWILQALDGHSSRTIGWVVAGGDAARMKRLDRKREQ